MNAPTKKRIGKYIIYLNNKLGQGAFSQVFLGTDEETKADVAVKVVTKSKINEDEYTKNAFYSEIQINKKLKSPNIIRFYDVHETVNNFYIVLQLAQHGTLRTMLRKLGRFDEKKTMKYLFQILSGFGQLVKNGITHRDLKPENILMKGDQLKLADFGFAKQVQINSFLHTLVGTPSYMAPQILREEKYTFKCDIWSLGVMTYEMLVGKIPWIFTQKTQQAFRNQIMTRNIVFPPDIEISDQMKHFILGCLQREEKDRFGWEDIFFHPILKGAFEKTFQNKVGSTQLIFILSNLRLYLHSKNINLNRILASLGEKVSQAQFIHFFSRLQKELTPEEIMIIYQEVADKDGNVNISEFTQFLIKYRIRLTGIDLSKYQMECEDNAAMKSSKPGIAIFTKLKITIDAKNVNVNQFLQGLKFGRQDLLDKMTFAKVIHLLDEGIEERDIGFLYNEFNINHNEMITFQEFSRGMCKIAEIVPMEEEK